MADGGALARITTNHERLTCIPFLLGAALCFTRWGSPPIALSVGIALALLVTNPLASEAKKLSGPLLRIAVVLLGFTMNLNVVIRAGASGAIFAAVTIVATLVLGYAVGKLLKIAQRTSLLISSGTAICGGSAIAAVGSVLGAAQGEMSVALGTVFILNALALYLFPVIGHALNLTQEQFGTWAGVAIHDISSVVGASTAYGPLALATATAVKLSRALWIVPLTFGATALREKGETERAKVQIPWFIGFFLLAALVRSQMPSLEPAIPSLGLAAKIGMTLTLFLIGSSLSKSMLKAVGWKPLLQGVVLWLFISVASLIVVTRIL